MIPGQHHLLAAGVTLMVNLGGLLLFFQLNDVVQPLARSASVQQATIDFVQPPPPRRRPRPNPPRRSQPRFTPPVPALDLPSGIQAPELLNPDLDGGSMLQAMMTGGLGASAGLILEEDEVDQPPEVVSRAMPVYPPGALDQEQEGEVTLRVMIDSDGVVRRVQVVSAEPQGIFEQAAENAVRQWRYTPAVYQGRRVSSWYRQRVIFRLR